MLFPLWDSKRQTLHDKVAGSVVLRVEHPRAKFEDPRGNYTACKFQ